MTVHCPEPRELVQLLDGELTENRGALVRAHVATCASCAAELEASRRLVERIAAPLPETVPAGGVAAVMARLEAAEGTARGRAPRRWSRAWLGLAAAAAVVALSVVASRPSRQDGFAPRGAEVAWARKIGVELWTVQGQPVRLASGERLVSGAAVVASYSNVAPEPAWLLAFAADERGEIHWLYPAWLDAAADPQAVRLDGSVVQRVLPESVVVDGVPEGALRFLTVVTRAPLRVSDVEALPVAERTVEALRRRWPDARVEELRVRYTALPPGPGDPP